MQQWKWFEAIPLMDFMMEMVSFSSVSCPRYGSIEFCDNQLMRFAASVGTILDHIPNLLPFFLQVNGLLQCTQTLVGKSAFLTPFMVAGYENNQVILGVQLAFIFC